ncbi:uncharacterized protein KY384_008742 [Bacidia gigantensis]|uniref:uncharacterized protein n=1 Tax=Bacidia gigantensis TaxID=2732470 RepID=UPI001D05B0C5|nr:uncharacterized protein KY384_008742 [Bacidia gigantensis]KAG8526542.1 hypothetical protein KY384_008742 [Bacidia gigantensis]
MADTKPLLAFYGATGGSCLACLAPALKAGYTCTALARTPSKLETALREKGVSDSAISSYLHITNGDVYDLSAVKGPLSHDGRTASTVFSGLGAYQMTGEIKICQDGVGKIFEALRELKTAEKPVFVALSSTGLTRGGEKRDLPYAMYPMYHGLLKKPHVDKIKMEDLVMEEAGKGESVIGGYVLTRASLLTNGKGGGKVRAGPENEPAIGYTISRNDVGEWMYKNLVKGDKGKWVGRKVSLTY